MLIYNLSERFLKIGIQESPEPADLDLPFSVTHRNMINRDGTCSGG